MTTASHNGNGYESSPAATTMDSILHTVTEQGQGVATVVERLIDESSRRQLVIRNLDDAVVLEVPLNGVIIGSVLLTMMMRLRWVVVVALLTMFGRFYITIEPVETATEDEQADAQTTAAPKRNRRRASQAPRLES
ncbi:MAG: DUF4342 domain-containing protein [Anaerolineae bacterium]|nr:DUF4342 domain-containing protein [Anaerolineae bacterium]